MEYTEDEDSQDLWEMMVIYLKIDDDIAYVLMHTIINMYCRAEVITIKNKISKNEFIWFTFLVIQNQFGLFYGKMLFIDVD